MRTPARSTFDRTKVVSANRYSTVSESCIADNQRAKRNAPGGGSQDAPGTVSAGKRSLAALVFLDPGN